jgi:hypothetical protein
MLLPTVRIDIRQYSKTLGIPKDFLDAILSQFEHLELCRAKKCLGGWVEVVLNAQAYDMARLGGFVAQEELLKNNFEKLRLELEELKPHYSQKFARIIEVLTNIGNIAQTARTFCV